jgi:hypothetical protein
VPEISDDDEEEDDAEARPTPQTHLDVPSPSESRQARTRTSSSSSLSLEPQPQPQPPAAVPDATDPKTPPVVRTTDVQEVEVEVERRMPGSFNYEAVGGDGGAAGSPIDVVGILGGLWRRFRLGP